LLLIIHWRVLQHSQDPLVGWEGGGIWAVDSQKKSLKMLPPPMLDLKVKMH